MIVLMIKSHDKYQSLILIGLAVQKRLVLEIGLF